MRDALITVPAVDSVSNIDMRDVVGNKGDTHDSDSLSGHAHNTNDHFHKPCLVYPTLANGVAVAGAAGVWGLGGFVQIVPDAAIGSQFDIHWISIEALDDNTIYEIFLYAVEVFIGHVRFTKNAQQDGTMNIPFQCEIQAAGAQIQAKLASAAGNSVATISLFYHIY